LDEVVSNNLYVTSYLTEWSALGVDATFKRVFGSLRLILNPSHRIFGC
jgi:hypothetical protein